MQFGVIGTNFVTDWFIEAGRLVPGFQLTAVYSRTMERAREYAEKWGAPQTYDALSALAASREVEAVYIASPTCLHARQALEMIEAGKHVLVEKPLASNAAEAAHIFDAARANGVVALEAIRNIFGPAMENVQKAIPRIAPVRHATLSFCQYSSRYDAFLAGDVQNAFRPELSNGAIMDIGVYAVEYMARLFGAPRQVQAAGMKLPGSIDAFGSILAQYEGMCAQLIYSKVSDSAMQTEIQGEKGTITVDFLRSPQRQILRLRGGETIDISAPEEPHDMRYEIEAFLAFAAGAHGAEVYNRCSMESLQVMDAARCQMGITFPADK